MAQKCNNLLNKSKKFFLLKKMQHAVIWLISVHFMGGHSFFSSVDVKMALKTFKQSPFINTQGQRLIH